MKRLGHTIKPDWLEKVEHMIDSAGKTTQLSNECLSSNVFSRRLKCTLYCS